MNIPSTRMGDHIQPFQIESCGLSGRLIRLADSVDTILTRHNYPAPVAALLGETLVLATILASGLKYDGVFTLQTKGDGPISMLVADVLSDGTLRGMATYDAGPFTTSSGVDVTGNTVPDLLGAGYLAFTVDQGPDTERYQGIVELKGTTLADCAEEYFRNSEQVRTTVRICAEPPDVDNPLWRAAGLMLQQLPQEGPPPPPGPTNTDREDEDWRRASVLMASASTAELLDPALHAHDLLYRLFHEDGVRVYEPKELREGCRCTADRVSVMLKSFPRSEIETMKEGGRVVVTCEFCAADYLFEDADLDHLYDAPQTAN